MNILLSLLLGLFFAGSASADVPKPAGPYYGVFRELPVTDVTPEGWLAQFLRRQRDGLGARYDLSGYPFDTCLWAGKIPGEPKPDGTFSHKPAHWDKYEQTAYLIDGLYRCGLLLRDARLQKLGEDNIQYVLAHPAADGKLGPTTGVKYREHQAYRPDMSIQCCTGNVHRFLPNYALRMWMSDTKGGLVAALYGPNTLQATAGPDHVPVTIHEETDYPFDGAIALKIATAKPVRFPLYVRIAGWADAATVSINGKPVTDRLTPATFYKLDRAFVSGDVVALDFPMKVKMENPVPEGVALTRGPLVYTLKIKVDAKVSTVKTKSTRLQDPSFPSWDLTAASPWNYALALKGPEDLDKVKVAVRPLKDFPWTPNTSPVVLTVPARRVPSWELLSVPVEKVPAWVASQEKFPAGTFIQTNPPLPKPPLILAAETEQVELIPEGATQLRISVFPLCLPRGACDVPIIHPYA